MHPCSGPLGRLPCTKQGCLPCGPPHQRVAHGVVCGSITAHEGAAVFPARGVDCCPQRRSCLPCVQTATARLPLS
jgi:hypothetical protein